MEDNSLSPVFNIRGCCSNDYNYTKIDYYQNILNNNENYKIKDDELEGMNVNFNTRINVNKI